jgi:arylsulfatase A-like enzyme
VLDALKDSGHLEDTVVILWSDHGWHLGEKGITGKNSLWERSTRVPLILAGPGVTPNQICREAVELLDIYPTLLEVLNLPKKDGLEGTSLTPQLKNAATVRAQPAITTHNQGNHAIRTRNWRYIRYADGSEELYDHRVDPNEWRNLAKDEKHVQTLRELATWLPRVDVPAAPGSAQRVLVKEGDKWIWEGKAIVPGELEQ